jgi:hypothetical protein
VQRGSTYIGPAGKHDDLVAVTGELFLTRRLRKLQRQVERNHVLGPDMSRLVDNAPQNQPLRTASQPLSTGWDVESTWWCPECGGEYRPGCTVCRDCGVALVAGPGMTSG